MVFILEGTPDLWIDGHIYRMKPGDTAGWPGRDGTAHCLINNTNKPVRMLTIGEASRYNSKIHFPLTRETDEWLRKNDKLWIDPPKRKLGAHDGLPDAVRGTPRNPMTRREVVDKARDLIGPVLGAAKTEKLIETAYALESVTNVRLLRPLLQRA